jgi:hypothetical protein
MNDMKKKISFLILIFVLCSIVQVSAQCAMCRATVETNMSEGRDTFGYGINFGILYLLSAPYLLIGGLILLWLRVGKKEHKARIALTKQLKEIYKK